MRFVTCGVLLGALGVLSACDEGTAKAPREPRGAPEVMRHPRRFQAPGEVAQGLDPGGRVLVFLELTNAKDGTPLEIDPTWRFKMNVRGPSSEQITLSEDPVIPRAWSNDEGIRLIGGFTASRRGSYQIEITSENCPRRAVTMIVLPIS